MWNKKLPHTVWTKLKSASSNGNNSQIQKPLNKKYSKTIAASVFVRRSPSFCVLSSSRCKTFCEILKSFCVVHVLFQRSHAWNWRDAKTRRRFPPPRIFKSFNLASTAENMQIKFMFGVLVRVHRAFSARFETWDRIQRQYIERRQQVCWMLGECIKSEARSIYKSKPRVSAMRWWSWHCRNCNRVWWAPNFRHIYSHSGLSAQYSARDATRFMDGSATGRPHRLEAIVFVFSNSTTFFFRSSFFFFVTIFPALRRPHTMHKSA